MNPDQNWQLLIGLFSWQRNVEIEASKFVLGNVYQTVWALLQGSWDTEKMADINRILRALRTI